MQMWVLGSGSRGNAVLVEADGTRLLVDAGFQLRDLETRLARLAVAPSSIQGVVVTHEHGDHVRGVAAGAARHGWTVYATAATITACAALRDAQAIPFATGAITPVGSFDVTPVRASHDAADPAVIVTTARRSGARGVVAYDLGHVTHAVQQAIADADVLVLEANHDEQMLARGPYPASVRERIAGRRGHLSNRAAAAAACAATHRGLRHVVLAHLSESCNAPATALAEVGGALRRARFAGHLTAAAQDRAVGPFGSARRAPAAVQLDLGV